MIVRAGEGRGIAADRVRHGELCVKADLMSELVYDRGRSAAYG